MTKIIIVVPGTKHLGEYSDYIQSQFPAGSFVLDKKLTGCGATTMFLKDKTPTLYCSPHTGLNECKANDPMFKGIVHEFRPSNDRSSSVFDLQNRMMDYIRKIDLSSSFTGYAPKVLITYDSFKHAAQRLAQEGILDRFRIVVDEFQSLFTEAAFKGDVEMEFLHNLEHSDRTIFVSATPVMENYLDQLAQFTNLPLVELVWPETAFHTANIQKLPYYRQSIRRTAARIIDHYKANHYFEKKMNRGYEIDATEAVFFLNDINQIIGIIKDNDLTPENTNIICARTEDNATRLARITDADGNKLGFTIGHAPQNFKPHKPYTFVTRTAFVGVDFYSTSAYTYIFSDINLQHLGLDIWLDVPQILGRQRRDDNPFKMDATFYYKVLASSTTKTDAEFMADINSKVSVTNEWIDTYNKSSAQLQDNMANKLRKTQKIEQCSDDYVVVMDDKVSGSRVVGFNELAMYNDIRAWDIRNSQYIDSCKVMTFIDDTTHTVVDDPDVKTFLQNYGGTFEQRMKLYCDAIDYNPYIKDKLDYLPQVDIDIKRYYNELGPDVIRSCSYIEARMKRTRTTTSNYDNLREAMIAVFQPGNFYSLKDIKSKLSEIYERLGIEKTAKATDLLNMDGLNVKAAQEKVDGHKENGYRIL